MTVARYLGSRTGVCGCGALPGLGWPRRGSAGEQPVAGLVDLCCPAKFGEAGGEFFWLVEQLHDPVLAAVFEPPPDGGRWLTCEDVLLLLDAVIGVEEAGVATGPHGRADDGPEGRESRPGHGESQKAKKTVS